MAIKGDSGTMYKITLIWRLILNNKPLILFFIALIGINNKNNCSDNPRNLFFSLF